MKDRAKNEEAYFVVPVADPDVTPEDIPGIEGMDDVTLFREAGVCDRAAGVALREARGCQRNFLWWIRRLRKFQDVIDARKARTPESPRRWRGAPKGGSLVECLVGIVLINIALLGLAQFFVLAVAQNRKGGFVASATFLIRQKIDELRGLLPEELNVLPELADELIDSNNDGTPDARRVTIVHGDDGISTIAKVFVFGPSRFGEDPEALILDPVRNRGVFAETIIGRTFPAFVKIRMWREIVQ